MIPNTVLKNGSEMAPENTSDNEEQREEKGNYYLGSEPFFSAYIQTQVYLNSVRMTFDERVAVSVADLASQLETARRTFIHSGDSVAALAEVVRIGSQFDQRAQTWEREAQSRESGKRTQSGEKISKMKAEHGRVRAKLQHTRRTFTKLRTELHQLAGGEYAGDESERPIVKDIVRMRDSPSLPCKPESTEATRAFVDRVLTGLIGRRLPMNRAQADRKIESLPGGEEQAIDRRLPILLVLGWYDPDDFDRRKAKRTDARLWLIPKTQDAARALSAEVDHIEIGVQGHAIDLDRIFFRSVRPDDSAEIPQSKSIAKFINKIRALRFGQCKDAFQVLTAKLNNLGPKQTELLLRYGSPQR